MRTKQLRKIISEFNLYFEFNNIKDEKDPAFHVMCHALIRAGTYKGYNYFKHRNGVLVLAGTSDPDKFDCLQIY